MSKKMKLHQVIVLEKTVKSRVYDANSKLYHLLQNHALFSGETRTYHPKDEKGETLPGATTLVQRRAPDLIADFAKNMVEAVNMAATRDWGNATAKANIVIDGKTLVEDAPVPFLLYLDKQLRDWRAQIDKVPELDPAVAWHKNTELNLWESEPIKSHRTQKMQRVIVKYEATKEHPAQADIVPEDQTVGIWSVTRWSGALPQSEKRQLLDRIDRVIDAVKLARETANEAEAQNKRVAEPIFEFLLGRSSTAEAA